MMDCICAHSKGNHPNDGGCQYQQQIYGSGYFCDCGSYRPLEKKSVLPPLGIKPRFLLVEERFATIDDAIKRYLAAYMQIPVEWIEERNEIIEYLSRRKV